VAALPAAIARDGLYVVQALVTVIAELGMAVGLLLQKQWVVPLYILSAAALVGLNWFWLSTNPPSNMHLGTAWLITFVFNLFPGALIFLRRNRLANGGAGHLSGIPDA
jgi:hypothetical protein